MESLKAAGKTGTEPIVLKKLATNNVRIRGAGMLTSQPLPKTWQAPDLDDSDWPLPHYDRMLIL